MQFQFANNNNIFLLSLIFTVKHCGGLEQLFFSRAYCAELKYQKSFINKNEIDQGTNNASFLKILMCIFLKRIKCVLNIAYNLELNALLFLF